MSANPRPILSVLRLALLGTLALPVIANAGITGICPDGSIFVVQRPDLVPCSAAKLVAADDLPPLRPQFLPRPYAWQQFQRQQDPNNPYNLVDRAREAQGLTAPPPVGAAPPSWQQPGGAPTFRSTPAAKTVTVAPTLADREVRDLLEIVALSQRRLPATFVARAADGGEEIVVRVAHSAAFEARLRRALPEVADGRVVLFSVTAARPGAFHPNLTFVQGHVAHHPTAADARQLGFLSGAAGEVAPGVPLLGYAVLPATFELSEPVDVYWDDRRLTARLALTR